jgi:hypothetical protein
VNSEALFGLATFAIGWPSGLWPFYAPVPAATGLLGLTTPADHPIRGASKVLPTGFPLVRVLTATANAPKSYFPVFELSMYIDTVTQVLPPGGFCPNRECLGPVL